MDKFQPIDRAIIENNILGAAPEQRSYLLRIWQEHKPEFGFVPEGPGFTLYTVSKRTSLDAKTIPIIWLLGHAAWRVFICHSPHVLYSLLSGNPLDSKMIRRDEGLEETQAAFETLLYLVGHSVQARSIGEIQWPQDIPRPRADSSGLPLQQRATSDLISIAVAYAFLHEIRHAMFCGDEHRPSRPEEELTCDEFARDFLLSRVGIYASESNQDSDKVLMKRAMGIALGVFAVYELTDRTQRSGTEDYPPFADRFNALISQIAAPPENDFWTFAATLLLAALRRQDRSVEFTDRRADELCNALIAAIRSRT